jgi:hypothetical protein
MDSDDLTETSPDLMVGDQPAPEQETIGAESTGEGEKITVPSLVPALAETTNATLFGAVSLTAVDIVAFLFVILAISYIFTVLNCMQFESMTAWRDETNLSKFYQSNGLLFGYYWLADLLWRTYRATRGSSAWLILDKIVWIFQACLAIWFAQCTLGPMSLRISQLFTEFSPGLPTEFTQFIFWLSFSLTLQFVLAPGLVWLYFVCNFNALWTRLASAHEQLEKTPQSAWVYIASTAVLLFLMTWLNQWIRGHFSIPLITFAFGLGCIAVRNAIIQKNLIAHKKFQDVNEPINDSLFTS